MNVSELCFVDSNIWLYAFLDSQSPQKSQVAHSLLTDPNRTIVISTQVINEVTNNLLKKANFSEEQVKQLIDSFYLRYRVLPLNQAIYHTAANLRGQYSLSYYDSLICAAAVQGGVSVLYTEDMHTGLVLAGQVTIRNPF